MIPASSTIQYNTYTGHILWDFEICLLHNYGVFDPLDVNMNKFCIQYNKH